MVRRAIAVIGAALMMMAVAAPLSADPPPESGVVVRISDDREGFGVFPDFINGYWVFSNVSRDDFCEWFADMENVPAPTNLEGDQVQLVFASDAVVVSVHAGGPTTLHAFAGDDPFIDPCTGSEPEPALSGHVTVKVNDNDGPNEGKRANSFGDRGRGELYDADGNAYRYKWVFRGIANPDNTEFKVTVESFSLRQIR